MTKKTVIDEMDKQIIQILQDNARTSYREIKEKLGISIGTIHNRISKLKDSGIIEGYTLKLNNHKLGYQLAYIIRMSIDGKHTKEVLDEIKQRSEVCSVFHTSGEQSAILICRFQEPDDVHKFIVSLNAKQHVLRTVSDTVLKEYKNTSFVEI